jgi:hypothetical protein
VFRDVEARKTLPVAGGGGLNTTLRDLRDELASEVVTNYPSPAGKLKAVAVRTDPGCAARQQRRAAPGDAHGEQERAGPGGLRGLRKYYGLSIVEKDALRSPEPRQAGWWSFRWGSGSHPDDYLQVLS